ncbi:MAG: Ig-like domain-containing protein [Prevotellaceae bacterium]|jgi:pectate lyase|nr:Ig-like domain-containing protein [Prevotellaceae bacterium]
MKTRNWLFLILLTTSLANVVSCGKDGPKPGRIIVDPDPNPIVTDTSKIVTSISLPETMSLLPGNSKPIIWTVSPETAENKEVTWRSSDSAIVTVDQDGVVSGVVPGEATITVTAQDSGKFSATCKVTVQNVIITNISLPEAMSLLPGNSKPIIWTVSPDTAYNKEVTWSSSASGIATVDQDGVVSGVAPGEATITVTAQDSGKFSATCKVTVQNVAADPIIQVAEGWLEAAYVTWTGPEGAAGFNVYYTGGGAVNEKIDQQLIRKYQAGYYRADVLGLAAGSYTIKIVPVFSGTEGTGSATTPALTVKAHDRSGFAHASISTHKASSGAYNSDGTLKPDAQVIYVTPATAKTVKLEVTSGSKGSTSGTGIGEILSLRQKGYDQTPLAIRFIGLVKAADMSGQVDSKSLLNVKGKNGSTPMNVTVEGVGNDATAHGWGILVRSAGQVEIRNMGFMMFPEDGVSLDTDNKNIWVHNCDFFYGKNGGGDKEKGDGSLDSKKSGFVTISYNHFWDSGKCNLLGNGTEPEEKLTYHHNWYDHSDSRHPRVRFHTVHVYNNYFDGNAKYGIGSTQGSSIFSEANYFRSCKKPMLISMQGTDTKSGTDLQSGTFSKENGGMIKAFNNYMDAASANGFIPYSSSAAVEFDAYVVSSKSQTVPGSVTSKQGGNTYNNFDADPTIMYSYTPDEPEAAKNNVMTYSGRMQGAQAADFPWPFSNADDANYGVNASMSAALNAHTSKIVSIQGEGSGGGDDGGGTGGNTGGGGTEVTGSVVCTFTASGGSNPAFTIAGNTSNGKGSVTVSGSTYTYCLKIESSTKITFTIAKPMKLTLIFGTDDKSKKVKIDGANQTTDIGGRLNEINLAAGTHTIEKGDTMNLFYISLSE